jgi:hypothetical protein
MFMKFFRISHEISSRRQRAGRPGFHRSRISHASCRLGKQAGEQSRTRTRDLFDYRARFCPRPCASDAVWIQCLSSLPSAPAVKESRHAEVFFHSSRPRHLSHSRLGKNCKADYGWSSRATRQGKGSDSGNPRCRHTRIICNPNRRLKKHFNDRQVSCATRKAIAFPCSSMRFPSGMRMAP